MHLSFAVGTDSTQGVIRVSILDQIRYPADLRALDKKRLPEVVKAVWDEINELYGTDYQLPSEE